MAVDLAKIEAIINWQNLKTVVETQSFLDLEGYYRRFVNNFSKILAPLTKLTHKDVPFVWIDECETSFQILKEKLTTAPALSWPEGSGGFVMHKELVCGVFLCKMAMLMFMSLDD